MKTDFEDVKKVVISLSGGLDSSTLLSLAVDKLGPENVYALSFSYGQQHDIELTCGERLCSKLGVYRKVIDISFLGEITKGVSSMVKGGLKTPTISEVEDQKTVSTYVPFRNLILSSITFAFAESVGADAIALGVQYGDYAMEDGKGSKIYHYWDCSPDFTQAVQNIAMLNDKHKINYIAPFVEMKKEQEIALGVKMGMDYGDTWTCYAGTSDKTEEKFVSEPVGGKVKMLREHFQPCGVCPSCDERKKAFRSAGVKDPCEENGVWGSWHY